MISQPKGGDMEAMPQGSRLTIREFREAKDLLTRWREAADSDSGSNDAEHEVGVDMAEFIFQLTGLPVGWNEEGGE